ncbi:HAD family hydrolase [Bacillus sp. 1P06AnD]|uniref:HAD family hydrolase n=1 Tax=Bacillus sp. 1P06AnD TaxID=3132208 RepID=UPI00399F1728
MIKAIIFDFDGLIIDTETMWYEAYNEMFRENSSELLLEEFVNCIGTSDEALDEVIQTRLGGHASLVDIKEGAALKHQEKMKDPVVREGVEAYIDAAREAGYKLAIASSSSLEWVSSFLDQAGLKDKFDFFTTKDEVEKVKPSPELYLKTLDKLQVEPSEALIFEDSLNGLTAALDAGIACVVVPNPVTGSLPFKGHAYRLESMADMPLADLIGIVEKAGERV